MSKSVDSPIDANQVLESIDAQQPSARSKATCAKCGTYEEWSDSWCPVCGYYPGYQEAPEVVDRSLQRASYGDEVLYDHWWQTIPKWGWVALSGSLAIIVMSVCARVHYEVSGGGYQGGWAFRQLLVGAAVALAAHARAAFVGLNTDNKLTPSDVLTAPIATWNKTLQALPKSQITVWMGIWGITLVLSAMAIVGGIRYSAVFDDWGFTQPDSDDAETILSFAQKREAKSDNAPELMLPPAPEGPFVECIVFGYFPHTNRKLVYDQIMFAGSQNGRPMQIALLRYDQIPEKHRKKLAVMLHERRSKRPLFKSGFDAKWVEPSIVTKISFSKLDHRGRLEAPVFQKVVKDLRKESGFLSMRKTGNYSVLIDRLDVDAFVTKNKVAMAEWEQTCEKLRAIHKKNLAIFAKKKMSADGEGNPLNLTDQGTEAKQTFEDIAEALED